LWCVLPDHSHLGVKCTNLPPRVISRRNGSCLLLAMLIVTGCGSYGEGRVPESISISHGWFD
jgi:hypothetical protein